MKQNIKWTFNKIFKYVFKHQNISLRNLRRYPMDGKMLANCISDISLLSRLYKDLLQSHNESKTSNVKSWVNGSSRTLSKGDMVCDFLSDEWYQASFFLCAAMNPFSYGQH